MRKYQIAAAAIAASGVMVIATSAAQAQGAGGEPPPAGVVSATPASGTPHLKTSDNNPIREIRQLVQCGNTMYAVGSFSQIIKGSTTYTRENVFSFQATKPYTVTSWAPDIVGTQGTISDTSAAVNTIAFVNGNCAHAYIGGKFTSINGTPVQNIAEIDTTTGNVVAGFGTKASGAVQTMVGSGNHLLVGGNFTGVNGSTADPYMVSLSPTTGKNDGFLHLNISGNYQYPGVSTNPTHVQNQQLSHGGTLDLVEGDFTSVGGVPATADLHAERGRFQRLGDRLDLGRVGRQRSQPAVPVRRHRAVLHPGGRLVAGRLDGLHRHDWLPRERIPGRADAAPGIVRRRGRVPCGPRHRCSTSG